MQLDRLEHERDPRLVLARADERLGGERPLPRRRPERPRPVRRPARARSCRQRLRPPTPGGRIANEDERPGPRVDLVAGDRELGPAGDDGVHLLVAARAAALSSCSSTTCSPTSPVYALMPNASIPSVRRTGFQRTPATGIASIASRCMTPYAGAGSTRSGYTTPVSSPARGSDRLPARVRGDGVRADRVPGPSVLFVISRGVALGGRAAVATVLGNAAGAYTQVVVVALGLGTLIERSATLFTAVKLVGARTWSSWACRPSGTGEARERARRGDGAARHPQDPAGGVRRRDHQPQGGGLHGRGAAAVRRPGQGHVPLQLLSSGSSSWPSPWSRTASGALPRATRAPGSAGRPAAEPRSAGSAALVMIGLGVRLASSAVKTDG